MKKSIQIVFSTILLLSFSGQCAAKSIVFLSFKINQKKLAATVCVNKNKPKSCCAAKCYLEKEIKKEDKRESNSSSTSKDKTEKSELRTGLIDFIFSPTVLLSPIFYIFMRSILNPYVSSVFHPPSL